MSVRRVKFMLWLLLLGAAAPAAAQLQAPVRLEVVERVAAACPGFILQDHAFTDAVATLLWREDARWGRNGKRGNAGDPSHDAIAWRNPASPFGVSIVDIIGAAGSPAASPAWIDQTQATIDARTTGVWVQPSGVLPACLGNSGGGTVPPPVVVPPQPQPPAVDLTPVLLKLDDIDARLAALEARPVPDTASYDAFVRDMTGDGPDGPGPLPPHVTDLKQRIDVIRVTLEQLDAWLRGRRVLRY
jgi:hypothetical protein